jgi:hypothetical protein
MLTNTQIALMEMAKEYNNKERRNIMNRRKNIPLESLLTNLTHMGGKTFKRPQRRNKPKGAVPVWMITGGINKKKGKKTRITPNQVANLMAGVRI